jgi:hypothetical protein
LDAGHAARPLPLFYLQKSAMAKNMREKQSQTCPKERRKALGRQEKTARWPGKQGGQGDIFF